jgi:hypothetical protein
MKGLFESTIWAILAVIVVIAAFFLTMPSVKSDGWVNQTLNVTAAVTCSVTAVGGGTTITFGNISTGGFALATGETAAANNSAVNVTAGSGNNVLMQVSMYGSDWSSADGHVITISSNEYYNVTNTTNWKNGTGWWINKGSFPTTSTVVDQHVNQSEISFIYLNMTVPSGAWGLTYSSNLTVVCAPGT